MSVPCVLYETVKGNGNQSVSFGVEPPLLNKRLTFAILRCLSTSALKGSGACGLWQRGVTLSIVYTTVSAPGLCGFSSGVPASSQR